MPESDRDQSIEQMLRRVMPHDVPPREECLDGETLAAWSDGSLRAAEASIVERHVAGCARCRALMASFIRTTPEQPVAESLWRRWHLGWVVPLATAATAAAIWIALPDNRTATMVAPVPAADAIARDETSAKRLPVPREEPGPVAAAPQSTMKSLERLDERAKIAESVRDEDRLRANEAVGQLADSAQPAAPAAPPPAAAATLSERTEADARDVRKEAAANSAPAPLAARRQAFADNSITSPDGTVRWRIVNGQQVERSTDAGVSWTPATLTTADRLTAAAAPSATVCWIVGVRGSVYLSTDAVRFVRIPFTEMVDLTAVFATDALTATVSSADGRSWRTTDQGKTWSTR